MNALQKVAPVAVTTKPKALEIMASRLAVDPAKLFDTLKATVFKNATNEELLALTVVANTYDLNPFLKEIYAFPAKGGGIVPIVSVDGWNKMLLRQPAFDGIEFECEHDEAGNLVSCTATIYVKDRSKPVKVTEYLAECKRNTDPWNNMPHRMLRNRTLCQASRIAFGFSGVHDEDEAATITISDAIVTTSAPAEKAAPAAIENQPAKPPVRTPQEEVESITIEAGYDFNHVQRWGVESGNIPDADSLTSFGEIKSEECKRILRAKSGFLSGLEKAKGMVAA